MLGQLKSSQPITIYGAGVAGLTLAFRLKKSGIPFTLYEKNRVGGKIATSLTPFGPAEAAASTLYMNAVVEKFVKELNIPYLVSTPKLKRRIWKNGPQSIFSLALMKKGITGIGKAFPQIREDSTVEEIFLPFLGQELVDELLSSALQGIHGAEARDLHFLSLFPMARGKNFKSYFHFLKELKKNMSSQKGSIKGSISFPGGMQAFINALHEEVKDHIKPLPKEFTLEGNIIICADALDAAEILKDQAPELARELQKIEYRPITSFTFFMESEIAELQKCFGMLIPQKFGKKILGVIHQSALFPENYKGNCYNSVNKGILSEEEALLELKGVFPDFNSQAIKASKVTQWKRGLPLFNYQRYQAIQNIEELLKDKPGVVLFGNYTKGISIRAMIEESEAALAPLKEKL